MAGEEMKKRVEGIGIVKELDRAGFVEVCRGILIMLLESKAFSTVIEKFFGIIYFFSECVNAEFDKKHSKIIKDFINSLKNKEYDRAMEVISAYEMKELIKDVERYGDQEEVNTLRSLNPLFESINVRVVEVDDLKKCFSTEIKIRQLFFYLFREEGKIFLMHPNENLELISSKTDLLSVGEDFVLPIGINDLTLEDLVQEESSRAVKPELSGSPDGHSKVPSMEISANCSPNQQRLKNFRAPLIEIHTAQVIDFSDPVFLSKKIKCRSLICEDCVKYLNKTCYFLINPACCSKLQHAKICLSNQVNQKTTGNCKLCSQLTSYAVPLTCLCCNFTQFSKNKGQRNCGLSIWTDISKFPKSESIPCSFCNTLIHQSFIFNACPSCFDTVCLHCLRKNIFIASGICSTCHSRRQITPLYPYPYLTT